MLEPDAVIVRPFHFNVREKPDHPGATPRDHDICLNLTQAQFEDYQFMRATLHTAIEGAGLDLANVCWYENPPCDAATIESIRHAIGASSSAQFIAYYPHSYQYQHYLEVCVDGNRLLYKSFSQGEFVKFAKAL
jgi:hypothetical protein